MKIKVVCRKQTVYRNGKSPVALRFTDQRVSRFVSAGVAIEARYWDDERECPTENCPDCTNVKMSIDKILSDYRRKIARLEALEIPVTFDNLFEKKLQRHVLTVEDAFKAEIARLEALGKYSSAAKHRSVMLALRDFNPSRQLLETISQSYLVDFEHYLRQRGNSDNSVATRFAVFKAIYNRAIREARIAPTQNQFADYKVGALWSPTRKRAITKQEIERIAQLEIASDCRSFYKRLARDLFLFSYYTAGINFCDIARLRYKQIVRDRLFYVRHKTGKQLSCRISEPIATILDRYRRNECCDEDYIFPILDRAVHRTEQQIFNRIVKVLRKVNRDLKEIGREAEISIPLTTYVARHTYATVLKREGVNVALISESLGHSNIQTTQIYLDSFENSQIDEAMKHLL